MTIPFQDSPFPEPVPVVPEDTDINPIENVDLPDQVSFQRDNETQFDIIVNTVVEMSGVNRTTANDFVEAWGQDLNAGTALFPQYPTAQDLFADSDFMNGARWLSVWSKFPTGAPPVFQMDLGDGVFRAFRTDFLRGAQDVTPSFRLPGAALDQPLPGLTTISLNDLIGPPPTSGGGGGGTGRADRTFDRNQLVEAGSNMWRSLLLDIDDKAVGAAVDDYMRQANGFWRSQGGNLDFDTFMLERIRGADRYSMLYGKKPDHVSEGQWIASHTNLVNSFTSLRPSDQRQELETSLASGASLAGQAQRIGRSERVQRGNPAAFTTRLANTVSRLGPAATR